MGIFLIIVAIALFAGGLYIGVFRKGPVTIIGMCLVVAAALVLSTALFASHSKTHNNMASVGVTVARSGVAGAALGIGAGVSNEKNFK
jgi:hypothetical protein